MCNRDPQTFLTTCYYTNNYTFFHPGGKVFKSLFTVRKSMECISIARTVSVNATESISGHTIFSWQSNTLQKSWINVGNLSKICSDDKDTDWELDFLPNCDRHSMDIS